MWQSTTSNTQSIPPNLLKNFNPFDILEPQKTGDKNSDEIHVDKLIDIDDSSHDSGFHELDASLLNKNKDFDLIDVYENIFVTPQHIKIKSKQDETINVSSSSNVDFKEFFDVIESGKKVDWTKPSNSKEETALKCEDYEETVKPRVLVPPVFNEPDLDPEELIYEVLAQKSIKKPIFNETKSSIVNFSCSKTNKTSNVTTTEVTFNNLTQFDKFERNKQENKTTVITETTINRINNNFTVKAIKKDEKVYKKKRIVKPESQTIKFTKGPELHEKSVVLPQIMARMIARQEYLEEKSNIKRRLILDSGSMTLQANISNAGKLLNNENKATEATCLNSAVSAIKSDTKKLTDAIIINENRTNKSGAKIVENLTNNSALNKTTRETDYGKFSPTVLIADCNKERLEDWQRSQLFKNFVLKGKFEL